MDLKPPTLLCGDLNPLSKELYFLIAKFLSAGPCQRASEALIEELEKNAIIPKSVNWLGEPIAQDYRTFSCKFDHINPNHLPKLLEQLVITINAKESSSSQIASRSLLSYSTLSVINKSPTADSPKKSCLSWSKKYGQNALRACKGRLGPCINPVPAILERSLSGGNVVGPGLIQPEFYKRMGISCNTLGHLSAVYCVLFDISGKYIFTGADDHLVKIWSAIDGRLLATLRGTSTEVSDLAVNQENTMLAVASCDKVIRVWSLQTCAPIATLNGQGNITSIFFCPMPRSRSAIRYLASTATDGSCAFWAYTDEPGELIQFQTKPTIYLERMRPGNAKMICSSFSSGGLFMAAGSADNHVRVYHMLGTDGPERILEVEHHHDRVDSISWAHDGLRFVSGSKDGTALIWRFESALWRYVRLDCARTPGMVPNIFEDPKKRPRVTMVGWTQDDALVLTAVSDFAIKVWDSKTGELVRIFKDHSEEVYVIESHPTNPRIVCTAGHDGKLIVWDVGSSTSRKPDQSGGKIFEYHNQLRDGQGHGAIFDCKWAPDGLSLAATDSHGHIMIFTIDAANNLKFKKLPGEIFFHTDYRPITRDAITQEIVDEQTQVPPHAMPPPFLVNMDGNPYSPEYQRLVPGRENVRDEYLIPNVAMSAAGVQEVIEGLPARSNIDAMIQQLAREQGLGGRNRNGEQLTDRERRGVGLRRSGEVEGVRQSRGDWQPGSTGFSRREVVEPIRRGVLDCSENRRLGVLEAEETWYNEHLTKFSPVNVAGQSSNFIGCPVDGPTGRSRRMRRLAAQAAERRQNDNPVEEGFSQAEGIARPNPRPQMEISVSQESPRRSNSSRPPPRRSIATLNNATNRRPRAVRYDVGRILRSHNTSDVENLDLDDSSDEDANVELSTSDSSEDSDSDSDWGGTLGASSRRREQEHRNRQNGSGDTRTRSHRVANSSSPERPGSEGSDDQDENEEPQPGPSSAVTTPASVSASVSTTESPPPKPPSRPRKARTKVDYSGGQEEIPEQYRPSEWFAEVVPRRSPYFPQLGDDLVYYRQGHETYIKQVELNKIYEILPKLKKSLSYVQNPHLEPEVSVRVVGIKFELEPPRVVVLKLARTDWETGELTNEHMYVKYHDVAHVVDFLILRQMHDQSTRRKWNEGDRFRCLIQREWWLGTVTKCEPFEDRFPNSNYLCYKVKWDNDDPETMSPWDMDLIPDDFVIPPDGNDGIAASDEDLRIGLYEPITTDWPPHGHQDAVCQKLSSLLEQVMELGPAEPFLTPVDLNAYPTYAFTVEYPMDLSTMKARLDNRFYRRMEAFKFDIKYIAMNAEQFNEAGSDIVKNARIIRDVCLEIVRNPNLTNINPVYHKISKTAQEDKAASKSKSRAGSSQQQSGNSSQKNKSRRRQKSTTHTSDSEHERKLTWQEKCENLLAEIWATKDAAPFREPVDIIEYPDYYQVIDTPIDLQAIREDLRGGNYRSIQDFHKDMLTMFANSKHFNTDQRSAIYTMTVRLQAMYEYRYKSIRGGGGGQSRNAAGPSTSPSKRYMTRGGTSASSTPRKNPRRSAAGNNPYTHNTSDEDDDDRNGSPSRSLRTGPNNKRREMMARVAQARRSSFTLRSTNGHTASGMTTPPRRNGYMSRSTTGTGSSGHTTSSGRVIRPVKRLRISSNESLNQPHSPQRSPRRGVASTARAAIPSSSFSTRPQRRHHVPIKNEPDSDEFEDSDIVHMPVLNQASNNNEYNSSEDSDDEDANKSLRRSSRKVKRKHEDSDDDGHFYGTRNRGKPHKSYAEGPSDDDESPHGKRQRLSTRGSPVKSQTLQPPVLRRRILSESEEDPNQPGPSSRMTRVTRASDHGGGTNGNSKPVQRIRNALEEDDEEEEEQEEEDGSENDSSEENSDDDSDEGNTRKANKAKVSRPQGRERRPLRQRQTISDDEDYTARTPAKTKKQKGSLSSRSRRATRGHSSRVDYAEDDSDSEPHEQISVSSRGRVIRTKSFLGD